MKYRIVQVITYQRQYIIEADDYEEAEMIADEGDFEEYRLFSEDIIDDDIQKISEY